jgi:hypothetical protein
MAIFHTGYIRAVVVAAGLFLCAVATPAAAQSFDRFLSGLSRCELTPEFEAFWRGIAAKYGNSHDAKSARVKPGVRVPVPASLRSAIVLERATSRIPGGQGYTQVSVPVQGTWLKAPLRDITFYLGNENGISLIAVNFAAPAGQVRAKFVAIVARNERMLRRKGSTEEFGSVSLRGTTLTCDRST